MENFRGEEEEAMEPRQSHGPVRDAEGTATSNTQQWERLGTTMTDSELLSSCVARLRNWLGV